MLTPLISDGWYQYTPSASGIRGSIVQGLIPPCLTSSPHEYMPETIFMLNIEIDIRYIYIILPQSGNQTTGAMLFCT